MLRVRILYKFDTQHGFAKPVSQVWAHKLSLMGPQFQFWTEVVQIETSTL